MKKIIMFFVILSALQLTAFAAVPHLINYQGKLTDSSNNPLNGTYSITFRIYDAETAGSLLWEETQSAVVIQKGVFSVLLGSVTSLNLAFDKPYFLEIKVGSEVMTPRQGIASAGYAVRAEEAEKYNGAGKVGTKAVDETGLSDGMQPYYDSASDKVKFSNSFGFGSKVTKLVDTVYQADTDGFIAVKKSTAGHCEVLSDSSNPPTTVAGSGYTDGSQVYMYWTPVRKGDYWKVSSSNGAIIAIYWLPLKS